MKKKIDATIVAGIILVSAFSLLLYAGITVPQNYIKDVRIPGIVEGSAKMVDTEKYFTRNILETAAVEIDITCNNSDHLELSVGYKTPYVGLLDISETEKEVKLWAGGELYPAKNIVDKALTTPEAEKTQLAKRWDLLEADFTTEDYVKADERIWYLKIRDTSDGPYGYNKTMTEVINGTTVTYTDYMPNMNYLNKFELCFNDMRFKTLLYPYFDGSKEVIIPIRGVDHEIVTEEKESEGKSNLHSKGSWTTITTTDGIRPYNHWAVVFATSQYEKEKDTIPWAVHGGQLFMFGQDPSFSGYDLYDHPNGIYDYGWSIMYCMDTGESSIVYPPTTTCTATDELYLKYMLMNVDSYVGYNDELIIFVHGHGSDNILNKQHKTIYNKILHKLGQVV